MYLVAAILHIYQQYGTRIRYLVMTGDERNINQTFLREHIALCSLRRAFVLTLYFMPLYYNTRKSAGGEPCTQQYGFGMMTIAQFRWNRTPSRTSTLDLPLHAVCCMLSCIVDGEYRLRPLAIGELWSAGSAKKAGGERRCRRERQR